MAYEVIQHNPAAVVEGLRSAGYSITASVADIIDNSLSAHASCVEVEFHWAGEDSWVAIFDNGTGMDADSLKQAMTLGSKNARDEREKHELGRFGMGLKTASWGVCKSLTVISKIAGGKTNIARLDLDETAQYNENRVHDTATELGNDKLAWLEDVTSGTIVIWEKLDRLVGDIAASDPHGQSTFMSNCAAVREHLEMVFHRFLEQDRVVMHMNRRELLSSGLNSSSQLQPWDPFLEYHEWTRPLDVTTIPLPEGEVVIRPFVLPHHSRFATTEEHRKAGGPKNWNLQQGFYVYRNERMIGDANWFRNGSPDEHTKLARICIDIPNTMDSLWQLDFIKSKVTPPAGILPNLSTIAGAVKREAQEIYRSRSSVSRKVITEDYEPMWTYRKVLSSKKIHYLINKKNPLVKQCRNLIKPGDRKPFDVLLNQIGATIPIADALIFQAEQPDILCAPNEENTFTQNLNTAQNIVNMYVDMGEDPDKAKDIVCLMYYPNLTQLRDLLDQ